MPDNQNFTMYIPLLKVDAKRREVWGIGADESVDQAGEVFDYAASRPYIEQWSDKVQKASGGRSKGNVRGQHGNVAAGRVIDLQFDDAGRRVILGVNVVDDNEWEKVEKGVYTGFSIGGYYAKRWNDEQGRKRYAGAPLEWSLVDFPNNHNATFELIKADGSQWSVTSEQLRAGKNLQKAGNMDKSNLEPTAEEQEELHEHDVLKARLAALVDAGKLEADQAADILSAIMEDEKAELAEGEEEEPEAEGVEAEAAAEETETEPNAGDNPGEIAGKQAEKPVPATADVASGPVAGEAPVAPVKPALPQMTPESIRQLVLDTLVQLGLAEKVGGAASAPVYQAVKPQMQKALLTVDHTETIEALQKSVMAHETTGAELRSDLAKVITAIANLEQRGFSGIVVREIGADDASLAKSQQIGLLREMLQKTVDPGVRQSLQSEITALEIRNVRSQK